MAPGERGKASDGAHGGLAGSPSPGGTAAHDSRFQKLVEHSENVITLVDASGRVTYASPSIERVLGFTPEEAVGRLGLEFIHPEDIAYAGRVLADLVLRAGASVHLQQRWLHKDGSWRMMDGTVTNLLDDPSVGGVASNFRDVTERQQALEALEATEMRYRLVARALNGALWDWDLATNEISWSEGLLGLFGYRHTESAKARSSFFELIHPEDRDRVSQSIHAIVEQGGSFWSGEYRMAKADGSYASVWARGMILHDEEGKAIRMVGALVDVTDRQAAERFREGVIDLVSHEFRTPITVIQGYAELLLSSAWAPDDRARQQVQATIERSSRHLGYLLNSIKELSRTREGGWRATLNPVRTELVLSEAIAAMESRRPGPWRSVAADIQAGAEELVADRRLLVIALVELLDNAATHSPPGAPITVSARRIGDEMALEVRDRGPGISPAVKAGLFKPFVPGDISALRRRSGAGLGLAVALGLVKAQGGRLEIDSKPGEGTCARITLSATAAAGAAGAGPLKAG